MAATIEDVARQVEAFGEEQAKLRRDFEASKVEFHDAVSVKFAQERHALDDLAAKAQNEFIQHKAAIEAMHQGNLQTVTGIQTSLNTIYQGITALNIEQRLKDLESGGGTGGKDRSRRSYLPEKNTIPKTFENKIEEWRQWKEDVAEYLDSHVDRERRRTNGHGRL